MSGPSADEDPLAGKVIAEGRYQIVRLLGRGGMGAVYLARQVALDRDVALKLIAVQEGALGASAVARFEQEMRATARVEHPNTIRLYDSGAAERNLYLAMEYLPGLTLRQVLERQGPLPAGRATRIALQIAWALCAAHAQRIVHRDLKPENIMLLDHFGEPDFVKVLDFGIARFLDAQMTRMTAAGAVIGTPAYMSPEQAQGHPLDGRTDLYALGVILYEMLAGRAPLVGGTPLSTLMAQVNGRPAPLAELVPGVPAALASLVMALLEKAPEARPADAAAVAATLTGLGPTSPATERAGAPGGVAAGGTHLLAAQAGGTRLLEADVERRADDASSSSGAPLTPPRPPARRRGLAIGAAALLLGGAAAIAVPRLLEHGRQPPTTASSLRDRAELDRLARERREPPTPADCPPCAPAALGAMVRASSALGPAAQAPDGRAALTALTGVTDGCAERWAMAARAHLAVGDATAARDDAGHAIAACPRYAVAHHLAGNAALKGGDAAGAAGAWRAAAALDSRFGAPRFNLALAALEGRDATTAIALLSEVIALDPDGPNAFMVRGQARLANGDTAAAERDLGEAVQRNPASGDSWYLLGLARAGHDDGAGANQAFCRASDLGRAGAAARCRR